MMITTAATAMMTVSADMAPGGVGATVTEGDVGGGVVTPGDVGGGVGWIDGDGAAPTPMAVSAYEGQ